MVGVSDVIPSPIDDPSPHQSGLVTVHQDLTEARPRGDPARADTQLDLQPGGSP
jgi:hypothetical protein